MCVVTFFGVDVQTWADVSAYAHMSIALPAGYSALEIVSLMSSVGYMGWLIWMSALLIWIMHVGCVVSWSLALKEATLD